MRTKEKSPLPKAVGIWLRVSTEDQVRGESLEHHEKRATMYCEARGWSIIETYRLDAVSGKAVIAHAEAQRMLADAKSGRIEGLVFSKLARLARNTRELLEIADRLQVCGVDLISLQEAIDTSNPAGRLFFTMIAAMAQWEREEISERVAASVPIRAKLGKPIGGPAPLGYRWSADKKLEIDPAEAPVRKLLFELFLEHKRRRTVARILNDRGYRTRKGQKFSDTTVERLIRDPLAKGVRRANYTRSVDKKKAWEYKPESEWVISAAPAVVSVDLWEACNRLLDERRANPKKRPIQRAAYLFSQVSWCTCGGRMFMSSHSPKYVCRKCRAKIPAEDLEAIFKEQLKDVVLSPQELSNQLNQMDDALIEKEKLVQSAEKELKKVAGDIDVLFDLYRGKSLTRDQFNERHAPLSARKKELDDELPRLQADLDVSKVLTLGKEELASEARDLTERWTDLSEEDKHSIVNNIVDRITIGKDEVEVTLIDIPFLARNQASLSSGLLATHACRRVAIRPKLYARRVWPKPKGYSEQPTSLAGHLLKRRKELGLLQREVAVTIGIGHETYITWEKRGRSPEIWHWPQIINFLGYDPHSHPETLPTKIAAYRRRTGLTHRRLAELIGVHECTLQSWERGRHPPLRSGRALKSLMARLCDGATIG
ncbi:MAG: recombinase family protein [Pirellulaceae bacterium]